ncbi:MAG: hypothetical protein VX899_07950 [Myxococcota bacterium]|nr:hypothetical protein [Myxococcota bacterium]
MPGSLPATRPLSLLTLGGLALLLWPGDALAQSALDRLRSGKDAASGAEGPSLDDPDRNPNVTPEVKVVGFRDMDAENDCPATEARYGLCIERVEFMDSDSAWETSQAFQMNHRGARKAAEEAPAENGDLPAEVAQAYATRTHWQNTGELYAQVWEDVAYRWEKDGDIGQSLQREGFTALPTTNEQWSASVRTRGGQYALPDEEVWLAPDFWIEAQSGTPIYRDLQYFDDGSGAFEGAPQLVLMQGRFAERLGYQGQLRAYDIFHGDPKSSGPFFEQMYPYESPGTFASAGIEGMLTRPLLSDDNGNTSRTELVDLRERNTKLEILGTPSFMEVETYASAEFVAFSRLLQVQIAQFAMEEFTVNQMRAMTALTAMLYPPGAADISGRSSRRLNAGSMGETDTAEEIAARTAGAFYSVEGGFDLSYEDVPTPLVERYILDLTTLYGVRVTDEMMLEINDRIYESLVELWRGDVKPLRSVDLMEIEQWANTNFDGSKHDVVKNRVKRIVLAVLMRQLAPDERDQRETWLLLDHATQKMAGTFDDSPGVKSAPGDVVETSAGAWASTLATHRYAATPIPQGLGAIDPVAVCSTADGTNALKEESFGAVHLDILVEAPDGEVPFEQLTAHELEMERDRVMWESREQVPFSMLDNPFVTEPALTRLVGMPGDKALYRIRWEIWTGWHILWAIEDMPSIDDNPSGVRLSFRTAAICEDTVLAPKDLVPTLVRAALLDGEFAHTDHVRRRDLELEDRLTAWPPIVAQIAKRLVPRKFSDEPPAKVDPNTYSYLSELIRAQVRDYASSGEREDMLLVVVDNHAPGRWTPLMDRRPRTSYARTQSRAWRVGTVRTASWAWYVRGSAKPGRLGAPVFPAYSATESVEANAKAPRWARPKTTDINIVGGLGYFPYRQVNYFCSPNVQDLDVISPCASNQVLPPLYSDGLSIDFGVYATLWFQKDWRVAIETGPELRMDAVIPGASLSCNFVDCDGDNPNYAFTMRPQLGLSVGIRHAPDPRPLRRSLALGYPWGADRADGSSDLSRGQHGVRGGFLVGPGYNGMEYTLSAEYWMSWGVRRKTSPQASFTPYHPNFVLGPYLRYQRGGMLSNLTDAAGADGDRYYDLESSNTVLIGVRGQYRLRGDQKEPDVPSELPQ